MSLVQRTTALRDLNKSLSNDRQIKSLILLHSRFSKNSISLINNIPVECRVYYQFLSIDNKEIRNMIFNSSSLKINEVPAVILVDALDRISIYEGSKAREISLVIQDLHGKHQLTKHPVGCNCPYHRPMNSSNDNTTPLELIKSDSSAPIPSLKPVILSKPLTPVGISRTDKLKETPLEQIVNKPSKSRLPEGIEDLTNLAEVIEDENDFIPRSEVRSKIRTGNPPSDFGARPSIDTQLPSLSHESLAISSLRRKQDSSKPPLSSDKSTVINKEGSMERIKQAALEMQKEREMLEGDDIFSY